MFHSKAERDVPSPIVDRLTVPPNVCCSHLRMCGYVVLTDTRGELPHLKQPSPSMYPAAYAKSMGFGPVPSNLVLSGEWATESEVLPCFFDCVDRNVTNLIGHLLGTIVLDFVVNVGDLSDV